MVVRGQSFLLQLHERILDNTIQYTLLLYTSHGCSQLRHGDHVYSPAPQYAIC